MCIIIIMQALEIILLYWQGVSVWEHPFEDYVTENITARMALSLMTNSTQLMIKRGLLGYVASERTPVGPPVPLSREGKYFVLMCVLI